jgi:hypothetical protein
LVSTSASGSLCDLLLRLQLSERRRLRQLQADVQSDRGEKDADQERNAPRPRQELRLRRSRQKREHAGRGEGPERISELDRRAQKPAVPGRRVLDHHEHRAAPFPAQSHTLKQAQEDEQDGRRDADLVVGGKEADEEGAEPHDDDRRREHGLAAEPVAAMPEDRSAQWPRKIADAERAEGRDGA